MFSVLTRIHLKVELLSPNSLTNLQTLSQSILHYHQQCTRVPVSLHPHQCCCCFFFFFFFFYSSHPIGYKMVSHWFAVLNCISLMTNDVEHLFMCLLAIFISSLENYLQILCPFKKYLLIWLWHMGSSIFVLACRIIGFEMQTLSWGMWDLAPWPGV